MNFTKVYLYYYFLWWKNCSTGQSCIFPKWVLTKSILYLFYFRSEKTRQAQIEDHGPLFDRILSFNEIPNLKFSIKLSFPEDYETAKRGPDFEIKLIEGGEMLNENNFIQIEISYSTEGTYDMML